MKGPGELSPRGSSPKPSARGSRRLTPAEARALLRTVRVYRFPIIAQYKATVRKRSSSIAVLKQLVVIKVQDRNNPSAPLDVHFGFATPIRLDRLNLRGLLRAVRDALHFVVAHEMDECTFVGGVRVFDPHERPRVLSP